MIQKLPLIVILSLLLVSCTFLGDYKSEKIPSPTGKYYLITSVNRRDKSKSDYAGVIIHLYASTGQLLSDLNTGAGDFSKWAIGWDSATDLIVVFSSDIGNAAYEIKNGKLNPVALTDELNKRALELKHQKYKE
jgi:hypothetical protein